MQPTQCELSGRGYGLYMYKCYALRKRKLYPIIINGSIINERFTSSGFSLRNNLGSILEPFLKCSRGMFPAWLEGQSVLMWKLGSMLGIRHYVLFSKGRS